MKLNFEKAIVRGWINLSRLNYRERVTLLGCFGEEVMFENDGFVVLFLTACRLRDELRRQRTQITGQTQQTQQNQLEKLNIISAIDNMRFPVIDNSRIYVRKSYKKLYKVITRIFKNNVLDTANRIIITGTSGIGKSAFLIYFIIRHLAEWKGNNPPIIIFHTKASPSLCYAFGGTSIIRTGYIRDFAPLLLDRETWYLVDSNLNPNLSNAKTIIAVSPKTLNSELNNYQDVNKKFPKTYYMAPWKLGELKKCREAVYSIVPQELMKTLYQKIGGVPRYVLEAPSVEFSRNGTFISASRSAYKRIQEALDSVKSAAKLLDCVRQAKDNLEVSSRILHRWPNPRDHEEFYLRWASTHILDRINAQLKDEAWMEVINELIRHDNDASLRGRLFELYVIHIFRKGGYSFKYRSLQKPFKEDIFNIDILPNIQEFEKSSELSEHSAYNTKDLFIPTIPNFPCLDLFLSPYMFQVTVSPTHPIKQGRLVEIVKNLLKEKEEDLHLCFVVPENIYDNYKK